MGRGITGYVGLAATLALAIPIAMFGVDKLLGGDPVMGGVALGLAGLMVAIEEHLTTPGDVPGQVGGKVVETVVKEPDEED